MTDNLLIPPVPRDGPAFMIWSQNLSSDEGAF